MSVRTETWPTWDQPCWLLGALAWAGAPWHDEAPSRPRLVMRRATAAPVAGRGSTHAGAVDVAVLDADPCVTGPPLLHGIDGRPTRCLAASEHLADIALAVGCPTVVAPPLWAPMPYSSCRGGDGDVLRIGWQGPLHWESGHDELLVALAALRHRGVSFRATMVGSGPDHERALFGIRDHALTSLVTLEAGPQAPVSAVHLLVDTSLRRRSGAEVAAAMAAGIGVVATDGSAAGDLVGDGCTGVLVGRRDPAALADVLELAAAHLGTWAHRGVAARRMWEAWAGDAVAPTDWFTR